MIYGGILTIFSTDTPTRSGRNDYSKDGEYNTQKVSPFNEDHSSG
jgi:hypothetical protein